MKKMIFILMMFFDLMVFGNQPPTYYIPADGKTINNLSGYGISGVTFYVTTSGSVNLGSNTYTLTYASLPSANTTWNVIFDASNLTVATATNVNLFGETPLATYSGITKFYINFSVVWDAGVPSKKVTYFSSLDNLVAFNSTVTFNAKSIFNDTAIFNGAIKATNLSPFTGHDSTVVVKSTGDIGKGCAPWCITGNSGIISTINFLGTTDTAGLNFRVANQPSGRIDYNLYNTSLGYQSLLSNTTASSACAFGAMALYANTTGTENTAIGTSSLVNNTTGLDNTGIGARALGSVTAGNGNTSVGGGSGTTVITGSNNTTIGFDADVSTYLTFDAIAIGDGAKASTYGIGIGYNANASANQLAIAKIRSISLPYMTSAINYVLTDTSGLGDFVPRPNQINGQTYFTPVTGDSVNITTSANLVDPAGTIANFTIILPASPFAGEILEFSFNQVITTLHWSTAASMDADSVNSHVPTAATAGSTIKIQFNSDTSTWYNY